MGRNIVLGFAGPGKVSETSIKDLLKDYLKNYDEVLAVFPTSDEYLSKTVLMLLDWAVDSKIPYEAIFDVETRKNKRILDESEEEFEVDNVSLALADRLVAARKDGDDARLIVAWGEDDEVVDRGATEKLVDLAQAKDLKVLDLTAGLDDLRFDSEEEEPEPEPEPKSRRSRRTAKDDESPAEEEKPRARRGAPRKAAETPPEPVEDSGEESVEAEVSRARQKAQTATEATPRAEKDDVILTALIQARALVAGLDASHAAMTLNDDREPCELYKLLGQAIDKYTASAEPLPAGLAAQIEDNRAHPERGQSRPERNLGGRPRSDGSPARKRTAAQRGKKQWQDEDGDWHDCGRGRPPKDVPLRTVDPKTGDVIDED